MAKRSSIVSPEVSKKRKLDGREAETDQATPKRARAGSKTAEGSKILPGDASSLVKTGHDTGLGAVVLNAEDKLALKQQRKEAKKAKRTARALAEAEGAAAALLESKTKAKTPAKSIAALQLPWNLSPPTAGRILDHDPVFLRSSSSEDYIIASNGRELQVLSQGDSLIVQTSPAPDGCQVQYFASSPTAAGLIYIAYSDGSTAAWEVDVDEPAKTIAQNKGKVKAFAVAPSVESDRDHLLYLIQSDKGCAITLGNKRLHKSKEPLASLQVVGNAEYVIAAGPGVIIIGRNKHTSQLTPEFAWVEVPAGKTISCFQARLLPTFGGDESTSTLYHGLSLVVGYNSGEIHFFDDVSRLFDRKDGVSFPPPRLLHWHRRAVLSAKFSVDGNYIISGGSETVLVLWQLSTGRKSYLPHLTSAIERIVVSPRGDRYALQMGDNSIMVLSTSELKPVSNFAGLQLAFPISRKQPGTTTSVATVHTQDSNRILLAVPSSEPRRELDIATRPFLQTFDTRHSKHVTRQALTRNNVTDFTTGPEGNPILPPDVYLLQMSKDGRWLVTVDEWMPPAMDVRYLAPDDPAFIEEERRKRKEVYLKFWSWDEQEKLWTLATRVDAPHARAIPGAQGAGKVFALAAHPVMAGFATVGEDGYVRIWKPKTKMRDGLPFQGADGRDVIEWTCKRTVDFAKGTAQAESLLLPSKRHTPFKGCLAYSGDGSLIAAAIVLEGNSVEAPLIHFINSMTGRVTTTSTIAPANLVDFGFIDRHLVAISLKEVYIWDLINDNLYRRHRLLGGGELENPILAINRAGGSFAVAAGQNISIFDTKEVKPVQRIHVNTTHVTSVLAQGRGYVVLSTDACIRTLTPNMAVRQPAAAEDIFEAESEEKEMDVQITSPDLLLSSSGDAAVELSTRQNFLAFEEMEDDRPVVRPEQLAGIFDRGQSFALPPVKDMFEAVVGLFARKPYVVRAAA